MNSSAGTAKNMMSPASWSGDRRRQPHRRAEHPGDLGIVAAAMGGSGVRIGERMVRGAQAVEFADEGEPRTGARPTAAP